MNELEEFRKKIDDIDISIIKLLSERLKVVNQIGNYKKRNNIQIIQINRWESLLNNLIKVGKEHNLNEDYIKSIWDIIHKESIKVQNLINE